MGDKKPGFFEKITARLVQAKKDNKQEKTPRPKQPAARKERMQTFAADQTDRIGNAMRALNSDYNSAPAKMPAPRSRSQPHKPKGLKPVFYDTKTGRMYTADKPKQKKKKKRHDNDDFGFGMGRIF